MSTVIIEPTMSDIFTLTSRQKNILEATKPDEWFASDIMAKLSDVSAATLRRDLSELVERGLRETR